ncbi:MAG TPA: ABC transporter substrate-binding protein [Microlunatus sp.]
MTTPQLPRSIRRRTLLQAAAVAGAGAGLLGTAGCESAVSQARELGKSGDDQPRRGGRLAAGLAQDVIPANFFTNTSSITVIIGLAYESLTRYRNDELIPQPRLATRWQLASDGKSIKLWLRKGVKFHNGREFTSRDVEASIRTYAAAKWNGQMRSTAAAVTGFDHLDDHTITLRFSHPLANIFDLLDTAPIIDIDSLDQLANGEAFIGTGPFKVGKWLPNTSITFDRFDDYWQPNRPYLDGIDARIMKDAKASLSALRSGQIDLSNNIGSLDLLNLSKRGGFRAVTFDGAEGQFYVGANVTAKPLDDIRVRQAIAYALDRERIVHDVLRGSGYPINLPWPKYSPAYDADRNQTYTRDLDKARKLIKEVGTLPTIPFNYASPSPENAAVAAIVQSNLADIGIKVELIPEEAAQHTKLLIGAQFPGLWFNGHSWAQYVPSTLNVSAYPFNAEHNASRYRSDRYLADANAAWTLPATNDGTDKASRTAVARARTAYDRLSDDLLSSLFLIEIAVKLNQVAVANRLQGVDHTKRSELILTDAYLTA